MSADTDRKLKAILLIAMLVVTEARGIEQDVLHSGVGRFAKQTEMTMTRSQFHEQAVPLGKQIAAMISHPDFHEQVKPLSRQLEAMLANPIFQEQAKRSAKQIEALQANPEFQNTATRIAEQIETAITAPTSEEQASLLAEQAEALMADTQLQEQAQLLAKQVEAMVADPDFHGQAKSIVDEMEAMVSKPFFQEQTKSLTKQVETMMTKLNVADEFDHRTEQKEGVQPGLPQEHMDMLVDSTVKNWLGDLHYRASIMPRSQSARTGSLDSTTFGKSAAPRSASRAQATWHGRAGMVAIRAPKPVSVQPALFGRTGMPLVQRRAHLEHVRKTYMLEPSSLSTNQAAQIPVRRWLALKSAAADAEGMGAMGPDDPRARAAWWLWRTGWWSWWAQLILTVICTTILVFAITMEKDLTLMKAFGKGLLLSLVALGMSVAGIIHAWIYTRLGRKLRTPFDPPRASAVKKSLRTGVILHLVGMMLSLISAEQLVGGLFTQSITAFTMRNNIGGMPMMQTPLSPLDVFVVQANTNILLSHFAGLVISIFLLFKDDLWKK